MTLYPCIMALWPQSCPCSNSLNLWTNFVHYVFYFRPSFLTCQKSIQLLILLDYSQSLENYILFKGTVNCCKVTEFIFTRSFSCVISQSFWWRVWQIVAAPKKSCPTIRAIWVWNQIKDSFRFVRDRLCMFIIWIIYSRKMLRFLCSYYLWGSSNLVIHSSHSYTHGTTTNYCLLTLLFKRWNKWL